MCSNNKRGRENLDESLGRQSSRQLNVRATLRSQRPSTSSSYANVPSSYVDNGDCVYVCQKCFALFWYDQRLASSKANEAPRYNQCCKGGDIRLPLFADPPHLFKTLFVQSHFLEYVRAYNSVFSMTSFGANIDDTINENTGPYVFKVEGQICHKIGSLCPLPGKTPSFLQLYVYDSQNELSNRLSIFQKDGRPSLDPVIISSILQVLDNCNQLVKLFRTARDLTLTSNVPDFAIRIYNSQYHMSYSAPSPGCIGAIVYNNDPLSDDYDIIVSQRDHVRKRISKLHPSYMSLQYPLLFPYGESGWSTDLKYCSKGKQKQLTMNMYYSFYLHDRLNVYSHLLRGGRLFQQFVVDAYVSIEHSRLEYFRTNQSKFRNELLQGIEDAILQGDTEGHAVGKRTFLPSTFVGGPRYMYKHYQDALAICRVHGNPQYFITFTCNVKWPEIQRYMERFPGLSPQDRPEGIAKVFQMKVQSMIHFLKDDKPFGSVSACIKAMPFFSLLSVYFSLFVPYFCLSSDLYTIEFQKRGLPHCHLLLWVTDAYKIRNPSDIDKVISAEIPDPVLEPELYKVVGDLMIHGPCGKVNPYAPCMSNGTCSKQFPKNYEESSSIDDNGYAHYMRRSSGHTVTKKKIRIDNGYVVPYNKLLSLRYFAHINVEYCGWSMLIKYLFKYISKGSDRIRFAISKTDDTSSESQSQQVPRVDEIQNFLDARFICPHEASWRILNYLIHDREPAVQVLAVHLENLQNITFSDSQSLQNLIDNPYAKRTTLTAWLENNREDETGCHLRYIDYISEYRWDAGGKFWIRRSRTITPTVARLAYIHPACGEVFYLRLLLTHQRGCKSFTDIRTVDGTTCDTYRSACERLGLLGDNREWLSTLEEANSWSTAAELRTLFTHMLLHCEITNPRELWSAFWKNMSDDLTYSHGFINDEDLEQYVLYEVELSLKSIASSNSLANYGLPVPCSHLMELLHNKLLMEEKNYNREQLRSQHDILYQGLNAQQLEVYNYVLNSISSKQQALLFVYGHGGTGKTYLWTTVISALRSTGKVVLAVAASGIASLLLPSGRTAHSRFRIPINPTENSLCNIKKKTQLSKLLEETVLIIWDEAPMSERFCLEALDRTLKDILNNDNDPFGGMSIVLGGDFRQTLPIKPKSTKSQVLDISLPRSRLWSHFKMFTLTVNMRLQRHDIDSDSLTEITTFAEWLLHIGNGNIGRPDLTDPHNTKIVQIPQKFLIPYSESSLSELISFIYDTDTLENPTADKLSKKAIVCPRNHTVDEINSIVLELTSTDVRTYLSDDTVTPHANNNQDCELLYPIEYLNSLQFPGIPPHCLALKVNCPVILLRNINQSLGLCNGTRLIVTQLLRWVIEARIITGVNVGHRVYIPRITLTHNDQQLPFTFNRKQFPLKLCYAMTINKSQGQSLNKIGVYLPQPVFSHGQLYVALSRATSPGALKVLIVPDENTVEGETKNIVYQDFLRTIKT